MARMSVGSETIVEVQAPRPQVKSLCWTDYFLLGLFSALLFGYVTVCGKPLTMHEARLPESSREMLATHQWLIPMNGDRPWLERPPFPHWVMMAVNTLIGQACDTEWSARIAPALMGTCVVLMVGYIAGGLFGRATGVMAGLALATIWEFYTYATLAEDDIFLAFLVVGCMALFVRVEFLAPSQSEVHLSDLFTWRRPGVVGFFILLGLTNLAKGPIVGAAQVLGAIGAYFILCSDQRWRIWRYFWVWGILASAGIALSWHVYVHLKYPSPVDGYLANLKYDFSQTKEFDEPFWYYPPTLLGVVMPWTPAAIVALIVTFKKAWRDRDPVLRFVWCWAIVPVIVLSLPHRKHHHYLVPTMAPWAILAALGLRPIAEHMFKGIEWTRRVLFGLLVYGPIPSLAILLLAHHHLLTALPNRSQIGSTVFLLMLVNGGIALFFYGLQTRQARWMFIAVLVGFGLAFSWMQTHLRNDTIPDTQFLVNDVDAKVPKDRLLAIDAQVGPLDFFRVQFYLRSNALLLHNLSYLRSDRIHQPDAYVVGRVEDLAGLKTLGDVEELAISPRRRQATVPVLTLFHLTFSPGLTRYPPPPVSPMQAMMRWPGPFCGPEIK
jgi:4-amino-4-deoxy-L-arabinose transferase-like glycosyltransferase